GLLPAAAAAAWSLEPGQAMGIATGGVVPDGADAAIPIEYVADNDNEIEEQRAAETGDHIRPRGGDIRAGEVVAEAGTTLTPARLGALAAAGVAEGLSARRPRAAGVPPGTDLPPPGAAPRLGQLYESTVL